jgi:predicted transcriptional regulator
MAEAKTKTARYISKYRNLTIAVKSAYYKIVEDKRVLVDGKRVLFQDGFFETTDADLMKELEQRPDFGTAFVRIPENQTVDQMREKMRAVDEKERELKEREAELDAREKRIKAQEEGSDAGSDGPVAVSEGMKRDELEGIAQAEGVPAEQIDAAANKAALVDLIEANRKTKSEAADKGTFEE